MTPPPLLLPHTRVGDVFKPVPLQQWFPSISPSALRRRDQLRRSSSWRELVDEGRDWLSLLSGKMGGEGAIQAVSKAEFWLELM